MLNVRPPQLACMRFRVLSLSIIVHPACMYPQNSGLTREAPPDMCVSISRQRLTTVAHHFRPTLPICYIKVLTQFVCEHANAETLAVHLHRGRLEIWSESFRRHITTFSEPDGSSMLTQGQRRDLVPQEIRLRRHDL